MVHLSGIIDMDYLKKCDATNCKVLVCFFVYTWLIGNVGNVSWLGGGVTGCLCMKMFHLINR